MVSRQEKIKFIIIRTVGNFLFLTAIWAIIMTFGPALFFEAKYRFNQVRNLKYEVATPVEFRVEKERLEPIPLTNKTLFGQLSGGDKVEFISPVSAQFGLVIPKIGANAPIIPNVDPGNEDIYLPILRDGIAHAMGTVFPGVSGNIFLFAHSTDNFWNVGRYNAVFYLLKELENGDEVDVFFNGKRHIYRVTNKLIVNPTEVEYLTKPTSFEQLTLQTCWPPGTTFRRLIVFARPERDVGQE